MKTKRVPPPASGNAGDTISGSCTALLTLVGGYALLPRRWASEGGRRVAVQAGQGHRHRHQRSPFGGLMVPRKVVD
jgi:hypothetical protein